MVMLPEAFGRPPALERLDEQAVEYERTGHGGVFGRLGRGQERGKNSDEAGEFAHLEECGGGSPQEFGVLGALGAALGDVPAEQVK
ncbi:hypothetical protein ACIBSV_37425 [Embleya sp. NPDC050154]|uniref:hypothetical protein n=1 Tax=Embleya sp. NPDC050154 TaxID=3363988 RepID=UPI00379977CF